MKRKKFFRQEWFRMGNRKKKWEKWRTPRGNQSKLRMHIKNKGFMPLVGYGSPKATRGVHPSGLKEAIVYNAQQLQFVASAGKSYAVRIAAGVGGLKRKSIQDAAEKLKLKILNPKKIEMRRTEKKTTAVEAKQ